MSKTKTIRIAYYICDDSGLQWRLSAQAHRDLIAGLRTEPNFANTRQKVLEIQYDEGMHHTHIRGMLYDFDADGKLDISGATEAIDIALDEKPVRSQPGVVDIEPVLKGKRWRNLHLWQPSADLVDAVESDLQSQKGKHSRAKIPVLK